MSNRSDELTEYFRQLGLGYSGDRRKWHRDGTDRLTGPYRDHSLSVVAERQRDGSENTGKNSDNTDTYRALHRNYLLVSLGLAAPVRPSVGVIPRREYALVTKQGFPVVDGEVVAFASDQRTVGADMLHSRYISVNRLLGTGVPEFDTEFGVICTDEARARAVLTPELAGWMAADQRSRGTRLLFKDQQAHLFLRSERAPEPVELFTPEWIFPAADYLIDVLRHAPVKAV